MHACLSQNNQQTRSSKANRKHIPYATIEIIIKQFFNFWITAGNF